MLVNVFVDEMQRREEDFERQLSNAIFSFQQEKNKDKSKPITSFVTTLVGVEVDIKELINLKNSFDWKLKEFLLIIDQKNFQKKKAERDMANPT